MAVMKAAARAVAVSRLAEKVANIGLVPFLSHWAHHWATNLTMQGPCQIAIL
jgi:hypothetical protein